MPVERFEHRSCVGFFVARSLIFIPLFFPIFFLNARLPVIGPGSIDALVTSTLESLNLPPDGSALVGGAHSNVRGLSGGERRRVSVGAELISGAETRELDMLS